MSNDIKRSDVAQTIVLHDFDISSHKDIKNWFEYVINFFRKAELEPTRIGISGGSYNNGKSTLLFKTGVKRLYEKNFYSVESITIDVWDMNDNSVGFAWITLDSLIKHNTIILSYDKIIFDLNNSLISKITEDLSKFTNARYGYFYSRNWDMGPYWYPFGIIQGLDNDDNERKIITIWGDEYEMDDGDYRTGDLRDIYPMNVICNKHLSREVFGTNLKNWVESNPKHGRLEELKKDLYAWWVDEDQISNVREALRDTRIILCI